MIRYVTSGESHGKQLTVIIDGVPAGLKLSADDINLELARRQKGHGRGERMKIETDKAEFVSGVRWGETIGSPITLIIKNADWENNSKLMSEDAADADEKLIQVRARPGHADLAGILKYDRKDIRDILERASARETAARVAAGAVFKKLISEFGVSVYSFTRQIGRVTASCQKSFGEQAVSIIEKSPVRTTDSEAEKKMIELIDKTKESGDTLGGVFTVVACGVPVGLGSHTQWDRKLDAKMAAGLMSVQAVKGVEFGIGFQAALLPGSKVHDEITYSDDKGYGRLSNNAGGFEGGITNGQDLIMSCAVKPIPSLKKPLKSVDVSTKLQCDAEAVRSDVCVVPAAGVVGEAVAAFEIARALKEKFGGDSVKETKRNFEGYIKSAGK